MKNTITYQEAIVAVSTAMEVSNLDAFALSFVLACQFDRQKDQVLDHILIYRDIGELPEDVDELQAFEIELGEAKNHLCRADQIRQAHK